MSISAIPGSQDSLARLQDLRQAGRATTARSAGTAPAMDGSAATAARAAGAATAASGAGAAPTVDVSAARAATAGGSALTQLAADLVGFLLQAQGSAAPRGSAPPPAPPPAPPAPPPGPPPDSAGTDAPSTGATAGSAATSTTATGSTAPSTTETGTIATGATATGIEAVTTSAADLLDRIASLVQMRPPQGAAATPTTEGNQTGQATALAPDAAEGGRPAPPPPPPPPEDSAGTGSGTESPMRAMVEKLAAALEAYAAQNRGSDGAAQYGARAATQTLLSA